MKAATLYRLAVYAMAVTAGLGLMSPAAQAQEKKQLKVSIIPIMDVAPLFAAVKEGYFKEQGLEIDTAPTAGGAVGIPGLVAGAYDIVFTNVVSTAQAKAQGLPVRIVAPGSSVGDSGDGGAGLLVRKGEGLKSGANFAGKSIGVNTQKNIIWLYARAWVGKTGGDPAKVTYRDVPFPQMVDALKGKRVDAIFAVDPFLTIGKEDPMLEYIGSPYIVVQPGVAVAQYIATDEFIARNPETLRRFNAGLQKGIDWVNKNLNTPQLTELIAGYTKINPAMLAKMAALPPPPRNVDTASIRRTITLMKEHELLTTEIGVDTLMSSGVK